MYKLLQINPIKHQQLKVSLLKYDCLTVCGFFKNKKVLLLNFANNDKFCNGLFDGNTQEEQLNRDTTLNIPDNFYPISKITTAGTFKGNKYPEQPIIVSKENIHKTGQKITICTIAALVSPRQICHYKDKDDMKYNFYNNHDREINKMKIKQILKLATHYDILISGAWGMGAFYNPEYGLIELWNECIEQIPCNICFAVPDDKIEYFNKYLNVNY